MVGTWFKSASERGLAVLLSSGSANETNFNIWLTVLVSAFIVL